MTRTFTTTCGAAVALALLAVTAPSATADPRQVVEESPEPTVWCTGVTTDDSMIEFDLTTSTTSSTVPHRGMASGAYWNLSPGCFTEEIRSLDVMTTENETFLRVDTPDEQAMAAVSGDGVQTGAVDWYDLEGEPLGTGAASVTWQQLSPRKAGVSSPTQTSNRVTHTTAYQLGFDLSRVDGGHLGNTCGVDFVEWRQIGGIEE